METFLTFMKIVFSFVAMPFTIYGYTFSVWTVILFVLFFCLLMFFIGQII